MARLEHPSIAHVYDFGEDDGVLYLAMEYVAGVSLSRLLSEKKVPIPASVATHIIADVCLGLHAAHEVRDLEGRPLGVVHPDISPQNLILTFDGRMKILDFGIALIRDRQAPVTQIGLLNEQPTRRSTATQSASSGISNKRIARGSYRCSRMRVRHIGSAISKHLRTKG